jgi:hypothetical protein
MGRRALARSVGFLVTHGRSRFGGNAMHARGSVRDGRRTRGRAEISPARQRFHGG